MSDHVTRGPVPVRTSVIDGQVRFARPDAGTLPRRTSEAVDAETRAAATIIVEDVRERGFDAVREHGERLGDLSPGEEPIVSRSELDAVLADIPGDQRALLERVAGRIRSFAEAQRAAIAPVRVPIPGGWAGHRAAPVDGAGCYAPGGRFPLPSSMLMTALTARAAGVRTVWAASPRPAPITLAAAAVADVDGLIRVGGAHAIAALAYGAGPVPAADTICGPGNRWVTAAKQRVATDRRIDMLAGPSELLLVADAAADPDTAAADLLAQAEHDPDAIPILVATSAAIVADIERALGRRLADLETRETAAAALVNGFALIGRDEDEIVSICDAIAPEHLQLSIANAARVAGRLRHYGGLFVGESAAEVLGDYGAGPNHTLPTGGEARRHAGLSVMDFLRLQTSITIDHPEAAAELAEDARALAELEGLAGHAAAAACRIPAR